MILGPYELYEYDPSVSSSIEWRRYTLDHKKYAVIYQWGDWNIISKYLIIFGIQISNNIQIRFYELNDAKNQLDKLLLNVGHILLTQEQWEKLKVMV